MCKRPVHFYRLLPAVFLLVVKTAGAQRAASVSDSLYKIAGGSGVARHFAALYHKSALQAGLYNAAQQPAAGTYLTAFENSFAHYFFESVACAAQTTPQPFSWQRYYSDTGLQLFQYYVIGMNAHINGDMWQALVQTHPYDSIKKYRQVLNGFRYPLAALFDSIYYSFRHFKKLRRLHRISLGLDKWYGKNRLVRWRKKQVTLALLYTSRKKKFTRRLAKTHRKMIRFDAFVIKYFR